MVDTGCWRAWQTAEEQLAELAAARAAAAADAEEAAQKLASLHAAFTAVTAERDQLRHDNERLRRKVRGRRSAIRAWGSGCEDKALRALESRAPAPKEADVACYYQVLEWPVA